MAETSEEYDTNCDDWRSVKDPKKRKQIQDRLAQRARRKRLAQQCVNSQEDIGQRTSQCQETKDLISVSTSKMYSPMKPRVGFGLFGHMPFASAKFSSLAIVVPKVVDENCLPSACETAYAALFDNGRQLGLTCGQVKRSLSPDTGPDVPSSLRPTDLQKTVVHGQWIDRFPFPYMRDACVSSLDDVEEEDFLSDLFSIPSLFTLYGHASWDPEGWIITNKFKRKWGHLFFPDQGTD